MRQHSPWLSRPLRCAPPSHHPRPGWLSSRRGTTPACITAQQPSPWPLFVGCTRGRCGLFTIALTPLPTAPLLCGRTWVQGSSRGGVNPGAGLLLLHHRSSLLLCYHCSALLLCYHRRALR